MRLSLNWLKEYVEIGMPPEELAHLLTMSGLEVEALEPLGQSLEDVVVAKILSVKRHSGAERLFICRVDTGNGEVPVVCSAPNLAEGAIVPMALPGASLPGGLTVEQSRIRGERSVGMLLAEDEMGLTDDHTGIMILPSDLSPGERVSTAMPLSDWAFDIGITPNRPDCASVMGIAREVAALTGQKLKRPEIKVEACDSPIEEVTSVTLEDPVGCPRYAAGIIQGIALKPSPFWMRYRLFVSGVRSINNVVDITNYVLLETGQPLHAFDYDRLKENRIVVRRAKKGETFTTLDGQSRNLSSEHLMICDGQRAVALAGIMGGLNSEIFAGSSNVLLESAYFDPVTIRRGSKRLGLSTEASYRFERGIDIGGVIKALERALTLISELAGGKVLKGVIDRYPVPPGKTVIDMRIDKTNRFLGTSLSRETMAGYLSALEMSVEEVDDDVLRVRPPTFRVDVTREIDLMEEVARLEGFEKIPVTTPNIRPPGEPDSPVLNLGGKIKEVMSGLSFTEIISYNFISPDSADILGAEKNSHLRSFVRLLNPLSVEQSVMRTSLVPGLLAAVKTNHSHSEEDLNLFEYGRVFLHRREDELPDEKMMLAAVMTGLCHNKSWYREERKVDFYDIKGAVEGLLKAVGLKGPQFRRDKIPPWYRFEFSSGIYLSDDLVGHLGQLSPDVLERVDLKKANFYLFEMDIGALLGKIPEVRRVESFAKFPAVFRDISIVVERNLESVKIQEVIEKEGGGLVESVDIFDLYEGKGMGPSEKAITFRICYRSREGTLDGKEINRLHESVIDKIKQKMGGRLREG